MDTMSIDDLGKLIRAAYGLDTSWRRAAACRRWEPDEVTPELEAWRRWDYEGPSIWQVDNDQIMNGIRGAKLIEIALMVWLGYQIGRAFGWLTMDALFLGAMLAISSTTIIVKALDELGIDRVQADAYAMMLGFEERIAAIRHVSATLMEQDASMVLTPA